MYLGCHLSSAGGFAAMGRQALRLQADTFQFFTRNPRGSRAKPLNLDDCTALREIAEEHHFGPLIAHAPYTINPCSASPDTRTFARQTMAEDLQRLQALPGNYYNFHPGSHVGQGTAAAVEQIAQTLNAILTPEQPTVVLLETMAGKGTEIGSRFEELRQILDRVECQERMGVCLDTCHVYDAGYDIVGDLDGVLEEFDRVIGLKRLKALHLNDSKNPFASHKDRHEKIGRGSIGLQAFFRIVRHPMLRDLPMVLETPNELAGYEEEIRLLRSAAQDG